MKYINGASCLSNCCNNTTLVTEWPLCMLAWNNFFLNKALFSMCLKQQELARTSSFLSVFWFVVVFYSSTSLISSAYAVWISQLLQLSLLPSLCSSHACFSYQTGQQLRGDPLLPTPHPAKRFTLVPVCSIPSLCWVPLGNLLPWSPWARHLQPVHDFVLPCCLVKWY